MGYIGKQPAKVPLTSEDIVDDSIESADIKEGTIVNSDINAAAGIVTTKVTGAVTSITSHGLATSATTDTTNADNIGSGTLPDARFPATLPAKSGVNLTALNASEITSGTVPDARFPATLPAKSGVNLTALNATEITSGTVADARISTLTASKLSGVVPTANLGTGTASSTTVLYGDGTYKAEPVADLTAVRQDIAMLALYNAVSDNRAAYNLPFSFIDQFEDDTGTTTRTDVANAGEYFASVYTLITYSALTDMSASNWTAGGGDIDGWTWSGNDLTPYNGANENGGTTDGASTPVVPAANTGFELHFTPSQISGTYGPYVGIIPSSYSGNNNASTAPLANTTGAMIMLGGSNSSGEVGLRYSASGTYAQINENQYNGTVCKLVRNSSMYLEFWSAGSLVHTSSATHTGAYEFVVSEQGGGSNRGLVSDFAYITGTVSTGTSATGTLISDTQTSSVATTKMSGVILYKDNGSGAATLGTQLKIYLSANGGSNWVEVGDTGSGGGGYGTVTPLFSSGVKMVRLGETTVTSGTTPVMKAVWASQASTTMITQLHGWAMNY